MIRPVGLSDIDFLLHVARSRYGFVDEVAGRTWLEAVIPQAIERPEEIFFRRTDHGAIFAVKMTTFFAPTPEAHMSFLVALPNRGFEGYRLLEAMIQWARALGASAHFGEQTGIDLSPYAKRLGAVLDRPSWTVGA